MWYCTFLFSFVCVVLIWSDLFCFVMKFKIHYHNKCDVQPHTMWQSISNKTEQIRSKQNNTYKRKQKSTVQHMKKKWGDNCRNFPYVPFQFSNFIFITLMADRKRQSHWNFNTTIMKYGDKKKLILLAILWNFFYFYFYFHFYNFLFFYTYLFRFILI